MDFVINKNTHQKLYPVSIGLGVIKILFETPWTTSTISLTYNSLVFDFLLDYIILVSGIYPMFMFYQPLSTSTRLRMCLSYYSKSRRVCLALHVLPNSSPHSLDLLGTKLASFRHSPQDREFRLPFCSSLGPPGESQMHLRIASITSCLKKIFF